MSENLPTVLAAGALAIGLLFGFIAQRSSFCMVAALSNWVLLRDYRHAHAYLAALGIAMLGTGLLEWGEWVAVGESGYRSPRLDWVGLVLGGLVFGFGSMLAGGCITRTLIRTAEGNLGALATLLVLVFAAMAAMFGLLEPIRGWLMEHTALYLGDRRSALAGWLPGSPLVPAAVGFLLCSALVLGAGDWRQHLNMVAYGSLIGLTVAAGWWLTGYLAFDEFEPTPPSSVSVIGPLTRGATYVTMGWVAGSVFGLFLIAGIFAGALAGSLLSRSFRLTPPDPSRLGAYLGGGFFMGVGAIMAGGCNIGQGLTGLATLSLQSIMAAAAIAIGMRIGLWWLQREQL